MTECKTCGKKLPKRTVKTGRQQEYCNTTCRTRRFFRAKSEEKKKIEGEKKPVRRPVPKKTKKVSKRREIQQLKDSFDGGKTTKQALAKIDEVGQFDSSPLPKEIPPVMPVREPGEDALSFAQRKNEWKKKYA